MGVMFDIKVLGYKQVFNPVNDLYVIKDKEKRKRRHKEKSKPDSNQTRKKHKKYPFKNLNLLDLTA